MSRFLVIVALMGLSLVACTREAPIPVAAGQYQPASILEAVLLGNRSAVENFLALEIGRAHV